MTLKMNTQSVKLFSINFLTLPRINNKNDKMSSKNKKCIQKIIRYLFQFV